MIVDGALRILVRPEPEQKLLKLVTLFCLDADHFQVLEFCNRFNRELIVCRASCAEDRDDEGRWPVVFDYDRVVMPDKTREPRTIVTLARMVGKARIAEHGLHPRTSGDGAWTTPTGSTREDQV